MHSIPLEEDELPFMGGPPPSHAQAEVEVLGDLRGHRLAGRYELVELLGSGELGCVYAGRDDATGQPVTVKVLALAEHRDLVMRLAERARQRFGLRHPGLAALLAEGNIGGLWYAVTEDAPGKNCYHVQGDPRLAGAGLQRFALPLVEGLVALHGAGAVHGAVTAGNIMWGEAGPRLVDLDLSLSEQPGAPEPGPADDVRALAGVLVELANDAPALAERLAALARGEARPSAAEWAAELRREAAVPSALSFEEPSAAVVASPPIVPPAVVASPPIVASAAEAEAVAPAASESLESIPEISGSQLVAETGSHAQVPEAAPVEAAPVAAAPVAAVSVGAVGADDPSAFGRASFEPVRAAIVGDDDDEDWAAAAPKPRRRRSTGVVVGLVAVVVLAVIGWQLLHVAQAPAEPPATPAEVVPAKRADLSPETSTLANVAAPAAVPVAAAPTPVAAADVAVGTAPPVEPTAAVAVGTAPPVAEAPTEPVEADEEEEVAPPGAIEQLSAGEFRKVLLRTNRSPAARACYRDHWEDAGDVALIATVGVRGTVRKLRMADGGLSGCLRKLVLGLEFSPAVRPAQHNFTFHRPVDGE